MHKRRIEELAKEVHDQVFFLLDGDIDCEPEDAGKIAAATEQAFKAKLTEIYGGDHEPV